ncbi:TPA: hypothetical protein ACQQHX_004177, partial [Pseudomonas aeruginosa]
LQLDQAASIQRRVTTCGGRRKTQPTVRDGLTTTSAMGVVLGDVLMSYGIEALFGESEIIEALRGMKVWLFNLDDSSIVPTQARKLPMISVRSEEALQRAVKDLIS